jgi:hypothetical protein
MSQKFDLSTLRKRNYSGTTITNTSTQSQSILSSPISSSNTKKAKYQCGKCDKILSTLSGFRNHLRRTHDGENPFKCDKCDLSYKHASGLCLHRRSIHGDTNELECTKCLKAFNCRGNLKRHLLTHVNPEELEEIWKQNYVHTPRQTKALERSQQVKELKKEPSSSSGTDDSQPLLAPLIYKASDISELRNPKMPHFKHLRLGSTIFTHFVHFREGKRFPLPSIEDKDDSSFNVFSCSSCKTSSKLSRLGLENHFSNEHPNIMESGKYCEICMKLVADMATHLRIHSIALSELNRFTILPDSFTFI